MRNGALKLKGDEALMAKKAKKKLKKEKKKAKKRKLEESANKSDEQLDEESHAGWYKELTREIGKIQMEHIYVICRELTKLQIMYICSIGIFACFKR